MKATLGCYVYCECGYTMKIEEYVDGPPKKAILSCWRDGCQWEGKMMEYTIPTAELQEVKK